MRAALLEASEKPLAVVDDIDIDAPRAGEVLVRVSHCGVCHSDLSLANGTFPVVAPTVLGHEAAGVVEAVGAGVAALAPGDKVVLTAVPVCNRCYWCARGEYGCCVNTASISTGTFLDGRTPLSRHGNPVLRGVGLGGFAEYAITTETGAIKVEPDTPLEIACVIGCAAQTGVGAVLNTARVPEGATVLVAGAGGIGISIVQGARVAGATRIIVSDPVAERRDNARRFGATDVVDPAADDVIGAVQQLTGGIGVDYAFDAVGAGPVIETCVWATRNGGTTVLVGAGGIDQSVTLAPPVLITMSERKIMGSLLGSCNGARDIPRLLALWRAGRIDLEGMITARRPLAEINDAFADMTAGRGLRTVLTI
ncbi:MAG TPA: Zn-dependent alcohol dehydrogenase [Acidimicrobiia bacterium]|nr:Zn-dependent alcohol dehydrogenase [Acidimicrobiia bacterium]